MARAHFDGVLIHRFWVSDVPPSKDSISPSALAGLRNACSKAASVFALARIASHIGSLAASGSP
jgi:hypothetical protein